MDMYLRIAWFIATVTAWLSFGFASWKWAENFLDSGKLILTILWLLISLILFAVGLRLRKSSS